MSDLGWAADGIERAVAAGGVELEKYRRPGYVAGVGVRRSQAGGGGGGMPVVWPEFGLPELKVRRATGRRIARR